MPGSAFALPCKPEDSKKKWIYSNIGGDRLYKRMERDSSIDIAKAIGILAVVVGHMCDTGNWLFSFHMPLFFILAGFFFRPRSLREVLFGGVRRLLVPYAATALTVVILVYGVAMGRGEPLDSYWLVAALYGNGSKAHSSAFLADMPVIGAIWFLLALFWCRVAFALVCEKVRGERARALWIFGLSAAAILLDVYVVNLPLALLPGIGALFFYWIGYWAGRFGMLGTFRWKAEIPLYACWLAAALYSGMSMVRCHYAVFPLDVLGACGGTLLVCRISWLLSKVRWLNGFLAWIGRNSLVILCVHLVDLDARILRLVHCPHPKFWLVEIAYCLLVTFILTMIPPVRRVFGK